MDIFCNLCFFVFHAFLSNLLALLCVMFNCVLSLYHVVPWVRCGT